MGKIMFRGKRYDGPWVYGDLIQYESGTKTIINKDDESVVSAVSVGQFTGLKDENGKEIFSGDIFEITDGDGWVVGHLLADINEDTLSTDERTIGSVIGNKHEHPHMVQEFCKD